MQPFDLQRIFFGDFPAAFLLEIVFRTAILYIYTLGVLRLIGQRGLEKLSSFDFAIVIAMGSAAGDPMFYPEIPLVHGMIVVTTILIVERTLGGLTKNPTLEQVIEGKTEPIILEGRIERAFMEDTQHSLYEMMMKLREQGARHLGEIEAAYLELDGNYSVFMAAPDQVKPGLPMLPPWDIAPPHKFGIGERVPEAAIYACTTCGETRQLAAGETFPPCDRCDEDSAAWVRAILPNQPVP